MNLLNQPGTFTEIQERWAKQNNEMNEEKIDNTQQSQQPESQNSNPADPNSTAQTTQNAEESDGAQEDEQYINFGDVGGSHRNSIKKNAANKVFQGYQSQSSIQS